MKRTKIIHNNNFKLTFYFSIILFSIVPTFLSLSIISAEEISFEHNIQIIDTPGQTYYFTATENIRMTFEAWGGGGKGGTTTGGIIRRGGGGGGGAYARVTVDLVIGDYIEITVGAGGSGNNLDGGISQVKRNGEVVLKAVGGKGVANNTPNGGDGGSLSQCTGDIRHSGGNGATIAALEYHGGGGGSSAGPAANGNPGLDSSGAAAPSNGGNGGDGRSGGGQGDGYPGTVPGGGGGGSYNVTLGSDRIGGSGGNGRIRIARNCRAYWYKADMLGNSSPADGTALQTWEDQSNDGAANNGIANATTPTWHDNKINFNPAVKFTNGYYSANRGDLYNDMGIYVVFSTEQSKSSSNWYDMPALIGGEASNSTNDWGFSLNEGKLFFKSTNSDVLGNNPQTTETYNTGKPVIASGFRKLGGFGKIYVNGEEKVSKDDCGCTLNAAAQVGIGRNPTIPASQFDGYIAEITGLSNVCSTTDQHINNTYYAIKYGITIEHDYKRRHETDPIIYSITSHNHDIAGLGRQDFMFNLHQKISSSSNVPVGTLGRVVISTSDNFTGSNVTVNRQELEDGQYLIWGHNNEGAGWTQINDKLKRQNRVWKIQNTSNANGKFVSGTYFQIDLNDEDLFPPIPSTNKSEVYAILMSKNSDFSGELDYVELIPDNNNLYSAAVDFPEGVSYFTVARMNKNYWTGAENANWNNTGNWGAGFIPSSKGNVIYATVDNYGTAAANDIIIPGGTHVTIKDIFNTTDKNLIISVNASLTINGEVNITDATNPAKIQIRADGTNPNGSIILHGEAQNTPQKNVYASIQMNVKGCKLSNKETWYDNIEVSPTYTQPFSTEHSWQFFGVPVQSIQAEPTFYQTGIRQYFEDYNGEDDLQYYEKWKDISNYNYLEAFKGYEITQQYSESASIYTVEGKLVYGPQTLTMTRKAPDVNGVHYGLGQNIFGNSFTSAIKVSNIEFPPEAEQTIYLYNTGSFADWGNATIETGTSAGQYTAIPKNSGIYDGQIPSMNGFLVRFLPEQTTYNGSDVSLTIPYTNETVEKNTKPQTAPRKKLSWLEVVLSGETSFDKLWLYSQDGTTASFDNGWDGFKFFGTPNAFIFTETEAGAMQVDADETIHGKLISFYANKNGIYTLHLVRDQLQGYEFLHLLDLETQQSIAIDRDTVSYTFTANSEGQIMRRFSLVDSPFPNMDKGDWALLSAFTYPPNKLSVQNFTTLPGSLRIYDTGGRLVMQTNINKTSTEFTLPLQAGVYMLHMQAGEHKAVKKVMVY